MSGYVGDLSSQQQEALRKLKALLVGVPKPDESDHYYLRWLRARKFNVKKAEEMLRKHLKLREEYGADTILQDWTPPEVFKFFPGGFFGEDRDGHPVWYDSINLDFRGMVRSVKKEDVFKHKWLVGATVDKFLAEWSEKKGKHFESYTLIIDLENMNLRRHYYWPAIKITQEVFAMAEANFPERMKQAIIVKAPSVFPIAYNLVKHFIDHRTKQKIVMLKGDNWQEELQKYIAPDQLPQAYGGTRCEPDPWCTDSINPGCLDIPPEYYLTNLTETSRDEMERLVVNRRSDHKITCEVEEPKSVLRWEFVTIDRDISFGVYFQKGGKNKEPVVPMKRRNSHVVPESGLHTCENTGTYVLKFDNSYSWTRSKEVFYSVKVYPPGTEISEPPILSETNSSSTGSDEYYDCTSDDFNGLTTGCPQRDDFNGLTTGCPQHADFNSTGHFTAESEVMEVCSSGGDLKSGQATVVTMKESIQTTI